MRRVLSSVCLVIVGVSACDVPDPHHVDGASGGGHDRPWVEDGSGGSVEGDPSNDADRGGEVEPGRVDWYGTCFPLCPPGHGVTSNPWDYHDGETCVVRASSVHVQSPGC